MLKKILLSTLFFSFVGFSQKKTTSDEITRIIIVRHAEKNNNGNKNPSLSKTGHARAERLNTLLNDFKIDALYSSPFARTTETLQPIAKARNLEIKNYNPDENNLALNLFNNKKGKTILVAGHSNTCPSLANILINESKYRDIDESDYGKIWIITFKNDTLTDCIVLNY
jgi:phosphohistidine phosphatase SixA